MDIGPEGHGLEAHPHPISQKEVQAPPKVRKGAAPLGHRLVSRRGHSVDTDLQDPRGKLFGKAGRVPG